MKDLVVRLAVGVVAVVLTLFLLSVLAESQVSVCVTPEQRNHLREVMLKAVDDALAEQVGHLFGNWVRDSAGQPKRAQTGTNNAVKAHVIARANVLAWDPQECTAGFQLQSVAANTVKPWR